MPAQIFLRLFATKVAQKWMAQGHEFISLEDIFKANIDKLKMRYPDGFETKKSLVRLKGDI